MRQAPIAAHARAHAAAPLPIAIRLWSRTKPRGASGIGAAGGTAVIPTIGYMYGPSPHAARKRPTAPWSGSARLTIAPSIRGCHVARRGGGLPRLSEPAAGGVRRDRGPG